MTFFCYIDTQDSDVPYMEASPVGDLARARVHALNCMRQRLHPLAARIYEDDLLVETLSPDPALAAV